MPFTAAHPAILAPLLWQQRRGLNRLALVCGAVAPDFEYFLRFRMRSLYSHTAWGAFVVDVPIALGLMVLTVVAYKYVLAALMPRRWQPQASSLLLPLRLPSSSSAWGVAVLSVVLGIWSHLLWDAFTHRTGWGVQAFASLSTSVTSTLPVYRLLQHLSTAAGLVVVAVVVRRCLRSTTSSSSTTTLPPAPYTWLVLAFGAFIGGGLRAWHSQFALQSYGHVIVGCISGALLACMLWGLALRRRSPSAPV